MTETSHAPAKRALLIGIDRYPHIEGAELQGCVNDMTALAELLRGRFGFPPGDVRLIVDAAATRDAILGAMGELADSVGEGDIVVLAFAGHGSQVTDLAGDEADGLDETIVPFDSGRGDGPDGRPRPNRDITDDELQRVLGRIGQKTAYVTVLFDCCHSGSGTRDLDNRQRAAPVDRRSADQLGRDPRTPADGRRRGWIPAIGCYVFAGACRDDERAWELSVPGDGGPIHHGAFSFFLLQELERCGPGDTMRDVFQRLSTKIAAARPGQHPQIEGLLDREVFGVTDIAPVRTVGVIGRAGALVRLDAGVVHGVTVGSRYAVFSPDVRPAPEREPLYVVEVAAARGVTSEARVLGEPAAAIEAGQRALEVAHAYTAEQDAIQLVEAPGFEAATAALRAMLEASPLLTPVGPGEPALAQVAIRRLRGGPHFATCSVGGDPLLPAYSLASVNAAAQLCEALEQRARHRRVLLLDNPSPTSPLRGAVTMTLLRQGPDGAWTPAALDDRGAAVYRQEERLAVEIVNRSNRWLFVYLLDLGMTGAVGQAYPPEGANEELAPGTTIRWFVRDDEAAQVFLPDGYPFEWAPGERPPPTPTVLKLIASTQPTDLGPVFQRGYAIPKTRAEAPLIERVLGSVLTGGRDLRVAHSATPKDDWTSVSQAYYIAEG
mgnify:CR=1 FL=1